MRERAVSFSDEARVDLIRIFDYLASIAGEIVALRYVDRIEKSILNLGFASERGQLRNDIRPNLRVVGFERRLTIAFVVEEYEVTILRIFSGGQNWQEILHDD